MSSIPHSADAGPTHRALHRAGWSLLLFPVSFAAASLPGEGIPSVLGYAEPSLGSTP